jgi:hypothetical protein
MLPNLIKRVEKHERQLSGVPSVGILRPIFSTALARATR